MAQKLPDAKYREVKQQVRGTIFQNTENVQAEHQAFVRQNDYALLVNLSGTVLAKQGSMVAHKGNVDFEYKGSGMTRFLKKAMTGEDLPLMKISGQGDVWLANQGCQVHVIELEGEQLSISGRNVLAFEDHIGWDIDFIKAGIMGFVAGGLFNITLSGNGSIAVTSSGTPIVIAVTPEMPVSVDTNAIIAWSTALNVSIKSSFKAQQLIGRSSGESFQMSFTGSGFVIVQPGEGIVYSAAVQ